MIVYIFYFEFSPEIQLEKVILTICAMFVASIGILEMIEN